MSEQTISSCLKNYDKEIVVGEKLSFRCKGTLQKGRDDLIVVKNTETKLSLGSIKVRENVKVAFLLAQAILLEMSIKQIPCSRESFFARREELESC